VQPGPERAHGQLVPVPSLALAPGPAYVQRPVQTLTAGEEDTLVVEERAVVLAAELLFVVVVVFVAAGPAAVADGGHVGEDGGS